MGTRYLFLPVDAPFTVYKTDVKASEWTLAGPLWKLSCSEAGRITEVFAQNKRDTVKTYKKRSAHGETKRHRSLTTVPTKMRLIAITLFIALPAAAYAAVFPHPINSDMDSVTKCVEDGGSCSNGISCC